MSNEAMAPERLVREHALYSLYQIMFPLWFGIAGAVLLVQITISTFGSFNQSVWAAAADSSKIYIGVIGILVTTVVLPSYVAHGMTRRNFARGVTAVLIGLAIITGVVTLAGYGVEHMVYSLADLRDSLSDTNVFGSFSRATMVGVSYALLNGAYFASGWLIGSTYYRLDWFIATLLLPITLMPVALGEFLVGITWGWDPASAVLVAGAVLALPEFIAGEIEVPFVVSAVAVVIAIAGAVALTFRVVRDVPIK